MMTCYHCTNVNPETIRREGWKVGTGFTLENQFEDLYEMYLPEVPVFITSETGLRWNDKCAEEKDKAKYCIKLDVTGLRLYPDFGSLPDTGAYYDETEQVFWWKNEGSISNPKLREYIADRYENLTMPAEDFSGEDSLELLGSVCVDGRQLIDRIIDYEENKNMKLNENKKMTFGQLKRLVKESSGFSPDSEAALNEFTAKLGEAIRTAVKEIYNNREAEGESAFGSFDIRDFLHRLVRTVKQYDLDIDEAALNDAAQNVVFSMYEGEEYSTITEEDSEERNPPLSICDRCGRMFNDVNAEIIDGDVLCPKCAKDGGKIEKHGFGFDKDGRPRMYSEAHGDKNDRGWRKNKGTVKKESEAYRWGDLKRKLQNGISNDSITVEDDE